MNGMSLQYTVCVCIMLCLYRILTVSCSVVVIVDYASFFFLDNSGSIQVLHRHLNMFVFIVDVLVLLVVRCK